MTHLEQDGENVLTTLRHSLFMDGVSRAVRHSDVTINGNNNNNADLNSNHIMESETVSVERYGVTVNLKPLCKMNRKTWNTYTPEKQVEILRRIHNSYLRLNPSTVEIEIHFESCPVLKQMHFHALIECPSTHISSYANFWEKYSGNLPDTRKPWRVIMYEPIYNEKGWLEYIRKDLKQ